MGFGIRAVAYIDHTLDYLVIRWGLFHVEGMERWQGAICGVGFGIRAVACIDQTAYHLLMICGVL